MVFTASPPTPRERILIAEYDREVSRRGFPFMLVSQGQKVHPTWIPVLGMGVPDLQAVNATMREITRLPTERIVTNWGMSWQQSGSQPEMMDVATVLTLAKRFKDAESDEALQREIIAEVERGRAS